MPLSNGHHAHFYNIIQSESWKWIMEVTAFANTDVSNGITRYLVPDAALHFVFLQIYRPTSMIQVL